MKLIEYHVNGIPTGIIEPDNGGNRARALKWTQFFVEEYVKAHVHLTAEPVKRKIRLG